MLGPRRILGVLLILVFVGWMGARAVQGVLFSRDCGGHLKRAADANTIELAHQELKVAIDYLEAHRMTTGYTSVIYQTPDEDVGFWYSNLKASMGEIDEELQRTESPPSKLEKSNMLIKLRKTLLDHGEKGESITKPSGIAVFPNNGAYALWGSLGFLALLAGALLVAAGDEY